MSTAADMNVRIGADLTDLLSKVDAAKAKLNQLTESEAQLKAGVTDLNASLKLNEAELAKTAGALTKLVDSGRGASSEANKLRTAIAGLSTNSKQLNLNLNTAKSQLAATTTQIKTQTVAMKEAEVAGGGFAKGATKAYSALRTLANIIPGIGIGGLVAAISGPLIGAFSAMTSKMDDAAKAQAHLNEAMADARGSVGGEIAELQSLFSIAKDTTLSYDARTQAIKELNKEYPDLHGNITLENVNTAKVTETINHEIEAIKRRAQAKALERLIDEESVKLEKARQAVISHKPGDFQEFLTKVSSGLGAPGLLQFNTDLELVGRTLTESQANLDAYTKRLNELNTDAANAGDLFVPPPPPKAKVEKVAKAVAKEYTETLEHALRELFEKGFKEPPDPFASLKKGSLAKISLTEGWAQGVKDQIKAIDATNTAALALQKTLENQADFAVSILGPAFDTVFNSIADGSQTVAQALGSALKQIIVQLAETVLKAAALAAIFAFIFPGSTTGKLGFSGAFHKLLGFAEGGEVKGPGTGTSDSILARLSKGEFVFKADTVKRIGVSKLDKINRGSAPSFEDFLGIKIPKFNSGGFVSPAFASNILSGSIGGGNHGFIMNTVIRGQDLQVILKRADGRSGRNT